LASIADSASVPPPARSEQILARSDTVIPRLVRGELPTKFTRIWCIGGADTIAGMVRPERRVVLAGASPVRVSAGASGSRFQPGGEIRPSRAECRKPLKEREQTGPVAHLRE
jgi:hypothetical protein